MQLRMTTSVIKQIDLAGGFDNYILTARESHLPGLGMQLRTEMLRTLEQRRLEQQQQQSLSSQTQQQQQ